MDSTLLTEETTFVADYMIELAAISISGIALFMSGFVLWKQHLKPFKLWCRFQSSLFDGGVYLGPRFAIVLPIRTANEGAMPGTVSSWAVMLRKQSDQSRVFVFHGAAQVDLPSLIEALDKGKIQPRGFLQGGNPILRLGSGEQRDIAIAFAPPESGGYTKAQSQGFLDMSQLTIGTYDMELWCFVNKWARYHKAGLDINEYKMNELINDQWFINNHVPTFDFMRPDLDPNPRGK